MEFSGVPNLPTLLLLLPIAAGVLMMLTTTRHAAFAAAMVTAALQAVVLAGGWLALNGRLPGWAPQVSIERRDPWFEQLGVNFHLVLDHAALGLAMMATLVVFAASVFAWLADRRAPGAFQGLLWISLGAIIGLFVARDLIVFYVFFELMLVPAYLLVGIWGGTDRIRAAATMFIYTVVGSLLMLAGLIAMRVSAGSFDMDEIALAVSADASLLPSWAFLAVLAAILVKAPLVPFHAWQPLAYREAPVEVTAVLSGVISKAAMFAGLAVLVPLFPLQLERWGGWLVALAVITLLYGSITAFRQPDLRGVLTYSSLAQMGLVMLGLFVAASDGAANGIAGSYLQAVNHGLVSAALFLLAGAIELRAGSGRLRDLGGAAAGRPRMATIGIIIALVALAVPGSNVFAGELLILLGAFQFHWAWGAVAGLAIVLAALYVLRLLAAVMHRPDDDAPSPAVGGDLSGPETLMLAPLVLAILALSLAPSLLRDAMNQPPVQIAADIAPQVIHFELGEGNGMAGEGGMR